jgi:hypothetical protein
VYHPDGRIKWFSVDPVIATGPTADELADDLRRMAEALGYPALDYDAMERDALAQRPPGAGE